MQIMHISDWLQQGKREYRRTLLVLGVFALALVLYSFHISRSDHSPSLLFYHLDLVRGSPKHDTTFSQSHQARTTGPSDHLKLSRGSHEIVHSHEEEPAAYYDQPAKPKGGHHSADESLITQPFMAINEEQYSNEEHHDKCEGKYVYIYELPSEFNEDLVDKCGRTTDIWVPLCGNLNSNGYGPPIPTHTLFLNKSHSESLLELEPHLAWYRTEQFSLEFIFHERLKKGYPCLTQDPELASAFYIPYYAALDTAFTLFDPHLSTRDRLAQRLIGWLSGSKVWTKFQGGKKHFIVLGRIAWDFSRDEMMDGWGSSLLSQVELSNVTRLLIERRPWASNEVAIPYPTSFHPSSLQHMQVWQESLRGWMSKRSKLLSSFMGSTSRGTEWSRALRAELSRKCNHAGANICQEYRCGDGDPGTLDCGRNPEQVNAVFLSSTFCLQPSGDSPTRKGLFDSLLAGCIPVLFSPSSAYTQYMWHLPQNGSLYSVLLDGDDVINGKVDVFATLAGIANDTQRLQVMQEEVISMLPRIVYKLPAGHHISETTFQDAVDVAVESFLAGSPIPTFFT